MAARRSHTNNHLQEAMALLIQNQAAFVEQIARNDQERLKLQVKSDEWQRMSEERFKRIEERLAKIEANLLELPNTVVQTILDQLPKIRKEIGFKTL
jgi:GTP1/Obg family GTP-binding protein